MTTTDAHRLPRTVLPRRYLLHLAPDLNAATFTGEVDIEVEITDATDTIVLNAAELEIGDASVESDGRRQALRVDLDATTERATLRADEPLAAGPASLHLSFTGILNDRLRGFYLSTFTDDDGQEQRIATTQMEATDARRAFPCWDEPDLKATFTVSLDVPDGLLAVSNAAEVAREPLDDGGHRVHFAETMVMSTYLVAFVVGPLEATDPVDVDGVPLRVVHRRGQAALTAFALESGAFALRHFTEYFGRQYPADKLDLVAVPDFAFGAMENLGCVTFRDALLLVDPERATQPELQRVADVIHHEIAHMWFGDLVTMGWWNGIWLNEAFATFMEMHATDAFRPAWDRWTDFGIARSAAFDTDALSTTRPIEFEVVSPADAEGMFDVLTYEKGAAVVRMLEQYLGADRFRDGIRLYIERHAHANTETGDLWDAIEDATGEPVRRIMDSWIFQGGHPVVSVEVEGPVAHLRQGRFRFAGSPTPSGPEPRWAVPVLLRAGRGIIDGVPSGGLIDSVRLDRVLLDGERAEVDLGATPDWVLVNSGGSGFYRVGHSPAGLAALAAHTDALTPLERYGLLDDAYAGLVAAQVEVATLLELVEALAHDTDLSVWQRSIGILGSLDRLVADEDRPALQSWVRDLLAPGRAALGPAVQAEEGPRDTALRAALLAAAGTIGTDPSALTEARRLFADGTGADADRLDAAVRIVAAHGDAATFAELRRRSLEADTPQDRLRHQGALADLPGDEEIDAFLALTLTDEVRTQDGPYELRRALTNRTQTARVWTFIAEHWDEVVGRFPSASIARMVEGIRTITDPALADAVEAHLDAHPIAHGVKPIAQHRERMRANVALAERSRAALAASLAVRTGSGQSATS